jgi:hypothetical protein
MGSGGYYGSPWTSPGYHKRRAPKDVTNLYSCTCGVYNSILPPEPCPIHDPERAYWRRRLLAEFGGHETTTVTTTSANSIPKYEAPKGPEYEVHYNYSPIGLLDKLACGADPDDKDVRWSRVANWITCQACKVRV